MELLNATGQHVRWLTGALAAAMVATGSAEIAHQNGKVRSIRLLESTATHAWRIGAATAPTAPPSVRFTRRETLEVSGTRVWSHHPRCCDYE